MVDYQIRCFWTGKNELSANRKESLWQLQEVSQCEVRVTLGPPPGLPRHPAYPYLSETHKADYLRTCYMHFYGGAYSDVKKTTGSWRPAIDAINEDESIWAVGYPEVPGGVAYLPYVDKWPELIGNGAYVFRSHTPLTSAWYNDMIALLDSKLDALRVNPARHTRDCAEEEGSCYPLEWNEMLGRIFHKWAYIYRDSIRRTLPVPIFTNYR
jgi:hypothetical protein